MEVLTPTEQGDFAKQSSKEKEKVEEIKETVGNEEIKAKREEIKWEQFLQKKLGKTTVVMHDDGLHVDHKIKCCGTEIDVPVLELEVEGQSGLINPEFLKIMQMSPAERRARTLAVGENSSGKENRRNRNNTRSSEAPS